MNKHLPKIILLLSVIILISGLMVPRSVFSSPAPTVNSVCEPGGCGSGFPRTFTIYKDTSTYLAMRGIGGGNAYSSASLSTVFTNVQADSQCSNGCGIHFGSFAFSVDAPLVILHPGLIDGEGSSSSLKLANNVNNDIFQLGNWDSLGARATLTIADLELNGNLQNNASGNCIADVNTVPNTGAGSGTTDLFLHGLHTINCKGWAYTSTGTQGIGAIHASSNVFENGTYGLNFISGNQYIVSNDVNGGIKASGSRFYIVANAIYNCTNDSTNLNGCLYIINARDGLISSNEITDTTRHGIAINGVYGVSGDQNSSIVVDGNVVRNWGTVGGSPFAAIEILGGTTSLPVDNVRVFGNILEAAQGTPGGNLNNGIEFRGTVANLLVEQNLLCKGFGSGGKAINFHSSFANGGGVIIRDNSCYNPPGNLATPFDNTNFFAGSCPNGGVTAAALPTSTANDYTISCTDLTIVITNFNGGTLTLKDNGGNTIISGFSSTSTPLFVTVGQKLRFVTADPSAMVVSAN